jgi:hypothetical protein
MYPCDAVDSAFVTQTAPARDPRKLRVPIVERCTCATTLAFDLSLDAFAVVPMGHDEVYLSEAMAERLCLEVRREVNGPACLRLGPSDSTGASVRADVRPSDVRP